MFSPVYSLRSGDSFMVPTGLVFVRFAEGVPAESHQDAIEQAGYKINEIPPYAPHAAWVYAQSGEIADALSQLSKLEAIPDVENVEPQMLMQRSHR
ncbi:MAG: hypothetical protein HC769_21845 [Cyanobacteria bacterium CRU_2_1]|nr:hypothetical protein [Cyanobacteria bacterium CRU_2_1]